MGSIPIRQLAISRRDGKENFNKGENRQTLVGQSFSTPFMNIDEEHNKRVTFNMTDNLEQKIDKLTVMMGKLVMKDDRQKRQFKS